MKIFWEIDYKRLVKGLSEPQQVQYITLPARDIVPLTIAIVDRDSIADAYTAQTIASILAAGEKIVFSAKSLFSDSAYLFYEDGFTVDDDNCYSADVDLNTEQVVSAIGSIRNKFITGELALEKNNRNYYTTPVLIELVNDVSRTGTTPAEAAGLFTEEFVDPVSGKKCLRWKNSDGEVIREEGPPGVVL